MQKLDNETLPIYDSASLFPNAKRLSSSQIICYDKKPEEFYLRHVLGVNAEPSVAMRIGSIFSALYQNRNLNYKKFLCEMHGAVKYIQLFERNIKKFPVIKNGHPEYPFIVKLGDWELRITLDDFVKDQFVIIENKTGQTEWTQERVDEDFQVTMQAWGCWKTLGVLPKKIFLNWLDMRPNTRKELWTFKTSRTMKQVRECEKKLEVIIKNIEIGNFTKSIYD